MSAKCLIAEAQTPGSSSDTHQRFWLPCGINMTSSVWLLLFLTCWATAQNSAQEQRSFIIGYNENCFLKDGECFRYISGSMHYFRVLRPYWKDRMLKMRAAGLNALQTYIEWRSHEPVPGQFDFSGNLDVVEYIKTAAEIGLHVILRPGPYICAERDMGGLPSWLLKMDKNMVLRSKDATYFYYVKRYMSQLLPLIKPLTYSAGGPVIAVQVENEYGSYFKCDGDYMRQLVELFRNELGPDVLLFTTDGAGDSYVRCGHVDGAYTTVDFGPGVNVTSAFSPQRRREPRGPLVNSEYYPGWLDHWTQPHAVVDGALTAKTLKEMLDLGASVNIYMMHGGTSFGYSAGANNDENRVVFDPTSYDYDAPISEAGDLTDKFMKIREVVGQYLPLPPDPLPENSTKIAFGPVKLQRQYPVIPLTDNVPPVVNEFPLTFEELDLDNGFVYYETTFQFLATDPVLLSIPGIRDRGYVYVDRVFQGILTRGSSIYSLPVLIQPGQKLSILVESQGRVTIGSNINDTKGIIGNVSLGSIVVENWNMWPMVFLGDWPNANTISIEDPQNKYRQNLQNRYRSSYDDDYRTLPALYAGEFTLPENLVPADTFLRLDGWYKGIVGINGFNLGRYWPIVGPQVTLYVPGVLLKAYPEKNTISLVEMENAPCPIEGTGCEVNFVSEPEIDGPTPIT